MELWYDRVKKAFSCNILILDWFGGEDTNGHFFSSFLLQSIINQATGFIEDTGAPGAKTQDTGAVGRSNPHIKDTGASPSQIEDTESEGRKKQIQDTRVTHTCCRCQGNKKPDTKLLIRLKRIYSKQLKQKISIV